MKSQPNTGKVLLSFALALGGFGLDSAVASSIFFEDFQDDFVAGRMVPDTVVGCMSTAFTSINNHEWGWGPSGFFGYVTLRDRDWATPGGEGGGVEPLGTTRLDIGAGAGGYFTLRFLVEGTGLHVDFDVLAYGGDGGHLFKYVSSDGENWTKVGDSSDAMGTHSFNLASGGAGETFLRLQAGTAAGIYEGIHLTNFNVLEGTVTEPPDDGVLPPPFPPPGVRAPEPATLSLVAVSGLALLRRRNMR